MTPPNPSMPPAVRYAAGCKINLYLKIVGRLPNGYHSLESLFLYLPEPYDLIEIAPAPGCMDMELTCPEHPELAGEQNILHQAYRLFSEATGKQYGLDVSLRKGIPIGAGLGGGSSDAALLLTWLNNRENLLPAAELLALGAQVGADVPFFLQTAYGGGRLPGIAAGAPEQRLAWAEGFGENLAPASGRALNGLHLLLVFPDISIATAWAYARWDQLTPPPPFFSADFQPEHLTSEIAEDKKPLAHALRLYNSFEAVIFPGFPALGRIKERLFREGAAAALMSGSGSTLFGLFKNGDLARQSALGFSRDNYKCLLQQL